MVNEKQFEDGKEFYLTLHNFILDRSGDCQVLLTKDLEWILKKAHPKHLYKIKLEKINTKEIEVEETTIIKKRVLDEN